LTVALLAYLVTIPLIASHFGIDEIDDEEAPPDASG
jgi:hypothetical protein